MEQVRSLLGMRVNLAKFVPGYGSCVGPIVDLFGGKHFVSKMVRRLKVPWEI